MFSSPIIFFIALYIYFDPFSVIYSYNDYNNGVLTAPNRDVVTSEVFINDYPKYHYKSFILGNSKTLAFQTKDWSHYINDSVPFHFDAYLESLYGLWTKLKYLDKINDSLKNVLIVGDSYLFSIVKNDNSPLYIKDYKIDGNSYIDFHLVFFKSFFSQLYFIPYFDYKMFQTYRPYMKITLALYQPYFSPVNNDVYYKPDLVKRMERDSIGYYKEFSRFFYTRSDSITYEPKVIEGVQLKMLQDIKNIFLKHRTSYKIIISPSYSQKYFNTVDLKKLQEIFGTNNVFDFSGKNEFTNNIGNYYDDTHYKPFIGSQILKKVYAANN